MFVKSLRGELTSGDLMEMKEILKVELQRRGG